MPSSARASIPSSSVRANGSPSAVPCTSTKRPEGRHHDVEVDFGSRVFGVVEVEHADRFGLCQPRRRRTPRVRDGERPPLRSRAASKRREAQHTRPISRPSASPRLPAARSQSIRIWRSPSAPRSMMLRKARPISRGSPAFRPDWRPLVASRLTRSGEDPGSREYFRGDPAPAGPAHPSRDVLVDRGRAQDLRATGDGPSTEPAANSVKSLTKETRGAAR